MKRKVHFAIILITLLALGLRFYRLANQSFWTDEVSSVNTARAPLNKIWQASESLNNSLPIYFLLLRPFTAAGAEHIEIRARALSALSGGLTIPLLIGVVYFWRREWRIAIASGLVLALSPLHLWYSQETRGYAIMLLFGALTLLLYERARSKPGPVWWAGYALAAILCLVLHKTGMIFFCFCLCRELWAVFRGRKNFTTLWPQACVGAVVIAVSFLKSYPPSQQYGRRSSPLEIAYTAMTYLGGYSFGPSTTEIQNLGPAAAVARHPAQVAILGLVLLLITVALCKQLRQSLRSKGIWLLVLAVGITALAALATAFPYNVRYTLPGLLGFAAVIGGLVTAGKSGRTAIVLVLAVEIWADAQWFCSPSYRKGDSRAVAQWLATRKTHVHSWMALPSYLEASIQFYLAENPSVSAAMLQPTEPQQSTFPPTPDALIIGRRHHLIDPDKTIERYRAAAGHSREIDSIAGFEIYTRAPDDDDTPVLRPAPPEPRLKY